MNSAPRHSPLHEWHTAHGGRMVDFAGWLMPIQYTSIVAEHLATRTACGLFDVSHMARFSFAGPRALDLLEYAVTNSVATMPVGQVRYSLVCNADGGILDDVLVYRGPDDKLSLVVNASNRAKIWQQLQACARELGLDAQFSVGAASESSAGDKLDVVVQDITEATAMLAVQGPRAVELSASLLTAAAESHLDALRYYTYTPASFRGTPALVSRTGYTGEDGFEFVVERAAGNALWEALVERGATPCGLGARDTLRLEAGMPLYGHELDETINPFQAGLNWAVKFDKGRFVGSETLTTLRTDPNKPRRVGLQLSGKRAAREGATVLAGGKSVGCVTSGTFSPTFDRPLAMAYLETGHATVGAAVEIDIRGTLVPAEIVKLPFYRRPS
ncbi:MAG: glycine cleavage system aminomethyltransferase GcvT [Planctomycetes bacterium]|nr:glycine cleavage system aminomethyltransferase GcvT [Planctomycetota bacterium]